MLSINNYYHLINTQKQTSQRTKLIWQPFSSEVTLGGTLTCWDNVISASRQITRCRNRKSDKSWSLALSCVGEFQHGLSSRWGGLLIAGREAKIWKSISCWCKCRLTACWYAATDTLTQWGCSSTELKSGCCSVNTTRRDYLSKEKLRCRVAELIQRLLTAAWICDNYQ